jgi:soluble lytic murein transglycosylase-like protein
MHPGAPGTQKKRIVLFLALLALRSGMAAGPIGGPGAAAHPAGTHGLSAAALSSADPASVPVAAASDTAPAASPAPASSSAPAATSPIDALVPPERRALQPILVQAATEYGLPADVIQAQAWAESSWRVTAVSSQGAAGVLQLTPDTVDFVSHRLLKLDHTLDPLDPAANVKMGALYLRHLLDRTDGDFRQALIAYNQGLSSLLRNGPCQEAEVYADRVLSLRPQFG